MTRRPDHGVAVWSSPAWRERAVAWLDDSLARAGVERVGPVEQPHVRPWATVLRAPTRTGVVWLKAAGPGTAFEAGLYGVLQRVAPAYVLKPIATDEERGWMVLEDGGVPLGGQPGGGELLEPMTAALSDYAGLQRLLAPHVAELLEAGVADMRPGALPARFEEALEVVGRYADRGDDRAALARVERLRPAVAEWSARLAASPGGASLDHNDLHSNNVFPARPGGRTRFFDWGDSVVAHPFASMLVALDFVRHEVLATTAEDPRLLRLRDAYLEVFSDLAPRAELVETVTLARRLALIPRTLIWARAIEALEPEGIPEEWARAPFETLTALLDA